MVDIFISWGSPDRAAVMPLRDRLEDLGLDIWEYSEDMGAGDAIQNRVMNIIGNSRIAVFCLSDQTVKRTWVVNEIAACVYAHTRGDIQYLVPVKIGELSEDNFPDALTNLNLNFFDLSNEAGKKENMERFVDDIHEMLGLRLPLIMPAAIFAMTKAESFELFDNWMEAYKNIMEAKQQGAQVGHENPLTKDQEEFWKLCKDAGMQDPPELFSFFRDRYGDSPEEMMPFETDKKIIDVINDILRQVNAARLIEKHRPIFLRWVSDQVFVRREGRDWWRSRDSLLIIDSISTFYNTIKEKLSDVPAGRTALLWLPPYTQHTAILEKSLRSAAEFIPSLGDEFSDWGKHPKRSISFDTSTSLALQVWLRRALFQVNDEPGALKENVDAFSSENRAPSNIGSAIFKKGGTR